MSQYLLTVSKENDAFVRKLLQQLLGIRVERVKPKAARQPASPEPPEWVDDLQHALREVAASERSEIKLKPARELLAELRTIRDEQWPPSR